MRYLFTITCLMLCLACQENSLPARSFDGEVLVGLLHSRTGTLSISENTVAEVFNLGSGAPASNKQLLEAVQKYAGEMKIEVHPNRPGDPAYLVADITKVKEILKWEPTQSSIDNVVATAVQWYNKTHKKEIQ